MSNLLDDLQLLNDLYVNIGQLNIKLKRYKYGTDNYFELLKEIDKLHSTRIKSTFNRKMIDAMLGKNKEEHILARLKRLTGRIK